MIIELEMGWMGISLRMDYFPANLGWVLKMIVNINRLGLIIGEENELLRYKIIKPGFQLSVSL